MRANGRQAGGRASARWKWLKPANENNEHENVAQYLQFRLFHLFFHIFLEYALWAATLRMNELNWWVCLAFSLAYESLAACKTNTLTICLSHSLNATFIFSDLLRRARLFLWSGPDFGLTSKWKQKWFFEAKMRITYGWKCCSANNNAHSHGNGGCV